MSQSTILSHNGTFSWTESYIYIYIGSNEPALLCSRWSNIQTSLDSGACMIAFTPMR